MVTLINKLTHTLKWFKESKTLPIKLRPYFLNTLAELMSQGFSINQSLVFLQLLLLNHQEKIEKVIEQLQQGKSIEKALHPLGYHISHIARLFYAQKQGRFILALEEISEQLKQELEFRKQLVKALAYPILMAIFLVLLLFGMREFMLPHIATFITEEVYESHLIVRVLISFFTYLPQITLIILSIILIAYLLFDFYLMRLPELKRYQLLASMPLVKRWIKAYCTHKISRELGYFFQGGYSIQQMLDTIIKYPIDPFLYAISKEIHSGMIQGESLTNILEELKIVTKEFPLIIQQGELTSQTGQKCLMYAIKLHEDLLEEVARLIGMLQPILFIIIAILVMGMYLLMLLPMLTMEI